MKTLIVVLVLSIIIGALYAGPRVVRNYRAAVATRALRID